MTAQPDEILNESFRVIEREVGAHSFSRLEWPLVRRMIHASGDVELAGAVAFQNDAAAAGLRALRSGAAIVTDVTMVAAGINKALAEVVGTQVHCYINDAAVQQQALAAGGTRSYWAMARALAEHPAALHVVGNAPTALVALCEAIEAGRSAPPLVIAAPVGFVGVIESKQRMLRLPVPLLTVRGRKGGSAVAAAAVNALLQLAAEGRTP
jgi:precorrin-8X/cobalt-precorrin-8 methylmutase